MAKKNSAIKNVSLSIDDALGKLADLGVLDKKDVDKVVKTESKKATTVESTKKATQAAFDVLQDSFMSGATVLPLEMKSVPADSASGESFFDLRHKVSEVRKDDRCLFDQYIGGNLKLTDQNVAMPKMSTNVSEMQGGVRILGNSIKELRDKVNAHVKVHGSPKNALIEGTSFVLNTRLLTLKTSSRLIDLSKKGGIIGNKYISFTEEIDGHNVTFAIQPELQPMVSVLLMYVG